MNGSSPDALMHDEDVDKATESRSVVEGAEIEEQIVLDEDEAWNRLVRLVERSPGRVLLGIAGSPGVGKTSYADYLAACCVDAAVVGLDGFQLSQSALSRMGRATRRGAPDTFDVEGYLALLRRLRSDDEQTVWAPEFRRETDDPVAGSVPVRPSTRVVITEGNYLLLPERPWAQARELCDEVWFVEVPERVRILRLVNRHAHYGLSRAQARARVTVGADGENAKLVRGTRGRGDFVVRMTLSEEETV
ncbi:nucleoside/nucleotide kinase family protein [Austwickia chelonae]|uniref:nucleoside/nucleotide kinase family protein n=1 Tax=Austwickia chelonae TaxID=100225 RepID=UPI0019688BDC|nr:nucleoside/nucleotide kinase family protein [Austwickia chelonae]